MLKVLESVIYPMIFVALLAQYTHSSHLCPLGCCSGALNGSYCILSVSGVSCSCEPVCEINGDCCGDYYQVCKDASCYPLPTWLNIESNASDIHLGDTIKYTCKPGYTFDEGITDTVFNTTCGVPVGNWTPDFMQCSEIPIEEVVIPIEGEHAQTIAGVFGALMMIQIILFIIIDIPSFKSNFIRCCNLKDKDKESKPENPARKRLNSVSPSNYSSDMEMDGLSPLWSGSRYSDKAIMPGRRRVSATTVADVKLDSKKFYKPKQW